MYDTMSHILGDYIGFFESKFVEFKEFILKIDPLAYSDIEDIRKMVLTGNVTDNFNIMIINNIEHYLKFYLPKYISAFGNTSDSSSSGELFIGINDVGEITGIPFVGELDIEYIKELLQSTKIFLDCSSIDDLFDNIKIDIIKLKHESTFLVDMVDTHIDDHMTKYNHYRDTFMQFIREQRKWVSMMEHFTVKMSTFIQDPVYRKEVAEYIRSKTSEPEYLAIAEKLEGTHEFTVLSGPEIAEHKNDMTNVYHWVTNYKDSSIDYIKSIRPLRPGISSITKDDVFDHQFRILTNLRKRFIDNTEGLNYYVIKITLPTNYKNPIKFTNLGAASKWIFKVRDVIGGNPCCM